jgi:hypothetical protein
MKIYRTDGTVEMIALNGKKATLETLQKAVGGWIEPVPGTRNRVYANEEGLIRGLPFNATASALFNVRLVGDVVELEKGDKQ